MSSSPIYMLILAAIAAFILFQLYNVLGKKVGRQPQEDAKRPDAKRVEAAQPGAPGQTPGKLEPAIDPMLLAAAAGLKARDPAFDPLKFLEGARQAYETIVRAYAAGDRDTLRPLLAPTVMTSFEAGIAARETRGETETVEFLHAPRADLEEATARDDRAVAKVRFLSEIRSERQSAQPGEEPVVEERRTAEHWTFERSIGAADPNWTLTRVEAASA